ncbi:hypothetical protein KIPB_012440, partial [Kipferlia bialata]
AYAMVSLPVIVGSVNRGMGFVKGGARAVKKCIRNSDAEVPEFSVHTQQTEKHPFLPYRRSLPGRLVRAGKPIPQQTK